MARKGLTSILLDGFRQSEPKESGLTRGGPGDAVSKQRYYRSRYITPVESRYLYESSWVGGNAVDSLVEDMTRGGMEVEIPDDPKLTATIRQELKRLKLQEALEEMLMNGFLDGDGYIAIGFKMEPAGIDLSQPPAHKSGIAYLHPFKREAVTEQEPDLNPFSDSFGSFSRYKLKLQTRKQFGLKEETWVHADRILHFQPFPRYQSVWGNTYFQRVYDTIQIVDNAMWSVGQIVYQMVFKVLKTDLAQFEEQAKAKGMTPRALMEQFARDINSLTLIVLDKGFPGDDETPPENGDELTFPSPAGALGSVQSVQEFLWKLLSGATRMPRTLLMGNEAGKLTGAEWDAKAYYARIHGMQEKHLSPIVKKVVDYLIASHGGDPEKTPVEIKFNPLFSLDEKAQADIYSAEAAADEKYIMNGVLMPDEVREMRFHKPPMAETGSRA